MSDFPALEGNREEDHRSSRHAQNIAAARPICDTSISPKQIYETLAGIGISFEHPFCCIEDAQVTNDQALGHILIPDTASTMPARMEHPHIIHPTTFDACMQMISSVLINRGIMNIPMVPTFIREMVVSSGTPNQPGKSLLVHTSIQLDSKRSFKANITAGIDTTPTKAPYIQVEGLICTAVPHSTPSSDDSINRTLCHRMQWEQIMSQSEVEQKAVLTGADECDTSKTVPRVSVVRPKAMSKLSELTLTNLSSALEDRLVQVPDDFGAVAGAGLDDQVCLCVFEIDSSTLQNCDSSEREALRRMLSSASKVLWITKGAAMDVESPEGGLISGLARTARLDNDKLHLVTFDMDLKQEDPTVTVELVLWCLQKSFGTNDKDPVADMEFAARSSQILVPRVVEDVSFQQHTASRYQEPQVELQQFFRPGHPLRLEVTSPGSLDSLRFVPDMLSHKPLAPNELRMQPQAYGVNFRDVMIALGQLKETLLMSSEHSGIVTELGQNLTNHLCIRDRICAWGGQAYASSVIVDGNSVHRILDDMTFQTAALISIIYATVYYALVNIARLQLGEKVLIHSAAGGVGQAAIILAKHLGAQVFVTVGSAEKKEMMLHSYGIPEERVFSSWHLTFAAGIKRLTDGKGVDVVLNSIAGESINKSLDCLSELGRFIEIGKRDILVDAHLSMGSFNRGLTFTSIDLGIVFRWDPLLVKRMLSEVFRLLSSGNIHPVKPLNVFSLLDLERAFRLIQAGKHVGKVILKVDEESVVQVWKLVYIDFKLDTDLETLAGSSRPALSDTL